MISKERLNEIALEVAEQFKTNTGYVALNRMPSIAQALLKAVQVEAESEVVGYTAYDEYGMAEYVDAYYVKIAGGQLPFPSAAEVKTLIALPLVSSEE